MNCDQVVVTRHETTVEWLAKHYPHTVYLPRIKRATEEDIRGKVVWGVLPIEMMHLTEQVNQVCFKTRPLRAPSSVEEMEECGAYVIRLKVRRCPE